MPETRNWVLEDAEGWAKMMSLVEKEQVDIQRLIGEYESSFRPQTPVEHNLVVGMAAASWHCVRLQAFEMTLLRMHYYDAASDNPNADPLRNGVSVCERAVADHRVLNILSQWQTRHHRAFLDNARLLLRLRNKLPRVRRRPAPPQLPARPPIGLLAPPVAPDTVGENGEH